ncbi:MAG: C45 family peptidase [Gammaproteobacteria bacterium]
MNVAAPTEAFPEITVHGPPAARGCAHGEALRGAIHETYDFYMERLFAGGPLGRAEIAARAERVAEIVRAMAPALAEEIEGIAAGAGLPAWQVYVLNGRTEILNARVGECSALYFSHSRLLAQTWDWVEPLEALCAVITHERDDGHRYVSLIEPGMLAKIGMNSAGVGVCLNILFAPHDLTGLPVHVLIAAVLNAPDFTAARKLMAQSGLGKASHLLMADDRGTGVSMEFMGDECHALEAEEGVLLHTNHCLTHGAAGRRQDLGRSCARYDRLAAMVAATTGRDMATARAILSTQDDSEGTLLQPYHAQAVLGNERVGTCATVLMELAERRFHVRRGPYPDAPFATVAL